MLYLDGKKMLEVLWEQPSLMQGDFASPTYIGGLERPGENVFQARLETPTIYNEFYYPEDPWNMGRGVDELHSGLCQQKGL